ncbi:hypothetical protein FOIG_07506 [Fusarium odoratissimum NRRL 54006]|uniref:Uncharacterized protein n=1 Tax=Fusarium odoratissimum (strain NRRL 54006) TaxID=1089451 RepID=X0KUU1_FUSO5|nr:uncharacterized protein FOIG_07506 [Fusarium odoratissimum NRRL 54006]EXM00525.1 hypothetical protein FOIG_07506 [Fusarium odoratissimum NRRL 54006]
MPMPTFLLISGGGQERRVEVIAVICSRTTTIPYPPSHQSEGNAPKRPTTTMGLVSTVIERVVKVNAVNCASLNHIDGLIPMPIKGLEVASYAEAD